MDSNRFCRAPNDAASAFAHFRFNDEREFVGDADRIDDQQRSGFRHVTDDAIESGSGPKNNQSAFQRAKPRAGTMLSQFSTPIIPGPIAAIISMVRLETTTSSRGEPKWHQEGLARTAFRLREGLTVCGQRAAIFNYVCLRRAKHISRAFSLDFLNYILFLFL